MDAIKLLWAKNRLLLIAFLAAVVVMLYFATRFVLFALYWSNPGHQNQPLEPWMTIGYVAHSWNLPREALLEQLQVPPARGHPASILEIAEEKGVAYDVFKVEVERTIQKLIEERPAK